MDATPRTPESIAEGLAFRFTVRLWNRLSDREPLHSEHASLTAALAFVESIEPGLDFEPYWESLRFFDPGHRDLPLAAVSVTFGPRPGGIKTLATPPGSPG